ncbi:MAG TPA: hypothetical protein VEJ63_24095 [Planctomycetota bacterium]|nr:hypothetical protein [Planctomycetota bacterium]
MTIEYISEGGDVTPAVVIYGRDWEACQSLEEGFQHLAEGKVKQVAVHLIPKFESRDGIKLIARVGEKDSGVTSSSAKDFEISLTKQSWARTAQALQPFCRPLPEDDDTVAHLDRSGKIALTIATEKL